MAHLIPSTVVDFGLTSRPRLPYGLASALSNSQHSEATPIRTKDQGRRTKDEFKPAHGQTEIRYSQPGSPSAYGGNRLNLRRRVMRRVSRSIFTLLAFAVL